MHTALHHPVDSKSSVFYILPLHITSLALVGMRAFDGLVQLARSRSHVASCQVVMLILVGPVGSRQEPTAPSLLSGAECWRLHLSLPSGA